MKFAQWLKMWVALAGLLASAGLGVSDIPTAWKLPLSLVVAGAGAFSVWKVENAPETPRGSGYVHEGPGQLH